MDLTIGDVKMGGTAAWSEDLTVQIEAKRLTTGDVIRLVSAGDSIDLLQAASPGDADLVAQVPGPGFVRVEIYRTFLPGIPPLPALISNPIYISESK